MYGCLGNRHGAVRAESGFLFAALAVFRQQKALEKAASVELVEKLEKLVGNASATERGTCCT
ncbi:MULTISPECIES: hypothetical protein [Brevibacillus]|uniref:hypothetical protein n=1 Tax=Brevibacillus TaxID=55080 RepID=UPI00156B8436|nr:MULTISPECIES: hypothetical protein [Brevibacillus]MBU8714162.1 hypothetical protein [Brevibacillus parabrevis]UED68056.1 hypothetical protein HP435_22745 [Brevibacillus sp. HD3.3A]